MAGHYVEALLAVLLRLAEAGGAAQRQAAAKAIFDQGVLRDLTNCRVRLILFTPFMHPLSRGACLKKRVVVLADVARVAASTLASFPIACSASRRSALWKHGKLFIVLRACITCINKSC